MADKLIQSESGFMPKIFPYGSTVLEANIDRAQDLDPDGTLNYHEDKELGNPAKVANTFLSSEVGGRLTQREYGSLEFYRRLANVEDSVRDITLSDFESSAFDIVAYYKDTDGDAFGTAVYEKQRLAGFSVTISDPEAVTDRSFDFVGENAKTFVDSMKYLIPVKYTCLVGDIGTATISIGTTGDGFEDYPTPVEDPRNSDQYIIRAARIRGTAVSDLTVGTDISFDGVDEVEVTGCLEGDIIKFYYGAATYISGAIPWTANTSDLPSISAHSASIYLGTANYLYRLQDVTLDVRLTREDKKEIGNKEVVQRGVTKNEVTVTLGRLLDRVAIEDILAGGDMDLIDINELGNDFTLIVALYDDSKKTTFKMGYKAATLYPSGWKPGSAAIETHVSAGNTLTGDDLTITDLIATLGL